LPPVKLRKPSAEEEGELAAEPEEDSDISAEEGFPDDETGTEDEETDDDVEALEDDDIEEDEDL
jgi:hypothetical protein